MALCDRVTCPHTSLAYYPKLAWQQHCGTLALAMGPHFHSLRLALLSYWHLAASEPTWAVSEAGSESR